MSDKQNTDPDIINFSSEKFYTNEVSSIFPDLIIGKYEKGPKEKTNNLSVEKNPGIDNGFKLEDASEPLAPIKNTEK